MCSKMYSPLYYIDHHDSRHDTGSILCDVRFIQELTLLMIILQLNKHKECENDEDESAHFGHTHA